MAPSITRVPYQWNRRLSIQFGGQPIPIGNKFLGNLAFVDLNDGINWYAQDLHLPDAHTLQMARLSYRGRAIRLADDHEPVIVGLPFIYEETTQTFAAARAQLLTAGDQWLTFDGGVTGINCVAQSLGKTKTIRNAVNDALAWQGEAEFLAKEPFFRDLVNTTVAATNIPASASPGTQTNINVTYNGSFWTEPLYTIAVPVVAGSPVLTITINNFSAGMSLTFNLPTASALSYVVDCQLLQVYQQGLATNQIQHTGSFPNLYPPPGQVNQLQVTATCSTACTPTLAISYQNRYTT